MSQPLPSESARNGVVAVVRREELFLVILRSQYVSAPGTYCFPGGGVEVGEDEPTALQRELVEELAVISSMPIRLLWRSKSRRGVDLAWWLTEIQSDPVETANPDEVAAVHWWSREELLSKENLLDSNRQFFTAWTQGEFEL